MSKYKLVNDQFKDRWINKPNNKGDVGDLQDITDELNRLSSERDKALEQNAKLREIAEKAVWVCVLAGVCLPDASAVRAIRAIKEEGLRLRAELDQIKEEAK